MKQLFIGLIAEGSTDYRFLKPIIEKAMVDIIFDCKGQIDIDVKEIYCDKEDSFSQYVKNASEEGNQVYGINMLIVHTDADDSSSTNVYENKINPAKKFLERQSDETHCKHLAALVPIRETEAWMLANKEAFIKTIGAKKNQNELNINGNPELFNNPKEKIEQAIIIGRADMPKKLRNALKISDLYSYLGQILQIESLKNFRSYMEFENNVKEELINLNLLPPKN